MKPKTIISLPGAEDWEVTQFESKIGYAPDVLVTNKKIEVFEIGEKESTTGDLFNKINKRLDDDK